MRNEMKRVLTIEATGVERLAAPDCGWDEVMLALALAVLIFCPCSGSF